MVRKIRPHCIQYSHALPPTGLFRLKMTQTMCNTCLKLPLLRHLAARRQNQHFSVQAAARQPPPFLPEFRCFCPRCSKSNRGRGLRCSTGKVHCLSMETLTDHNSLREYHERCCTYPVCLFVCLSVCLFVCVSACITQEPFGGLL